jgi:hypothetical protein
MPEAEAPLEECPFGLATRIRHPFALWSIDRNRIGRPLRAEEELKFIESAGTVGD